MMIDRFEEYLVGKLSAAQVKWLERWGIAPVSAVRVGTTLAIIVLVVGIAVGIAAAKAARRRAVEEASKSLVGAVELGPVQDVVEGSTGMDIHAVALLKLAKTQYREGNFSDASASYDEFLLMYPDHPMVDTAVMGKIFCLESRHPGEALMEFGRFARERTNSYLVTEARFGVARCYVELGDLQRAKEIYEELTVDPDAEIWVERARKGLDDVNTEIDRRNGTL
jgi:tetratricopeptide (TPR) repeat protein